MKLRVFAMAFGVCLSSGADAADDLTAKFDSAPAFKSCPAIGAGSSLPPPKFCQDLETPETYCRTFQVNDYISQDSVAQNGSNACQNYFKSAVESHQVVCNFIKDEANLQAGSAHGNRQCAKKLYGYYQQASLRQAEKLKKAYEQSNNAIDLVTDEGNQNLKAELHCQKNGAGNKPPGLLLLGLSEQAKRDQKEAYDNLSSTLSRFSMFTMSQANSPNPKHDLIPLSGIGKNCAQGTDHVGTASESILRPVATTAGVIGTSTAVLFATGAAESLEDSMGPLIGINVAKAIVIGKLAHGHVEKADYALAGTGALLGGATLVDFPAAAALGISMAARVGYEKFRANENAYDNQVALAYKKWTQEHLQLAANSSSGEVASAYANLKKQYAYCSQCGNLDRSFNCPAVDAYKHGYNDDYLNVAHGYTNPWVKDVWNKNNRTSFPIPTVSPTAFAPGPNPQTIEASNSAN